jgi:predicted dehydrogenase
MNSSTRRWRILVSGVGSVGERHIRNLLTLGQDQIAVHRTRALPFRTLDRTFPAYNDLDSALSGFRPDIVFVTGPTATHLQVATVAAEANCHVFVEKPLADSLDDLEALRTALARNGRLLMVGYMLRFHPLVLRLKSWLEQGTFGRPLHWRSTWAEYLPDFHPWEDYRQGYAARRDLGGGPAHTFSHDIDLALWLFGPVERAWSVAMPPTPLRIDVPAGVDLLLQHRNRAVANLHLDFYQRPPQRSYEIVGSHGRAMLDYHAGRLTRHEYRGDDSVTPAGCEIADPTEVVDIPQGWDRNDLFLDEVRYFVDCIGTGRSPVPGLDEGVACAVLAAALATGGQYDREAIAGAAPEILDPSAAQLQLNKGKCR